CRREEVGTFGRVMAELVAQGAKGARRVAEASGDLGGGKVLDKIGAQRLVLALSGFLRGEEETGLGGSRERISCTGSHGVIRLQMRMQLSSSCVTKSAGALRTAEMA